MAEIIPDAPMVTAKEQQKQKTISEMEPGVRAALTLARVIVKNGSSNTRDQYLETLDFVEGRWEAARDNFIELTVELSSLLKRHPAQIAMAIVQIDERLRNIELNRRAQQAFSGQA